MSLGKKLPFACCMRLIQSILKGDCGGCDKGLELTSFASFATFAGFVDRIGEAGGRDMVAPRKFFILKKKLLFVLLI